MTFTREQIAKACRDYGRSLLNLPPDVDGPQLMWALAGNESSFGANCTPRFEKSYFSGRYSKEPPMPHLISLFGEAAACSYGPWQVMLCNCYGYKPEEFSDLEKCAEAFIAFLNRQLERQKPVTLKEVFDMYNSGNWRDSIVPTDYIAKGVKNYQAEMPVEKVLDPDGSV